MCSIADPSLFVLKSGNGTILLLSYVDAIIVTGDNPSLVSRLVQSLGTEFTMKDLGPLHYFLGVEVTPFDGGLFISQSKYALELLYKTKMLHSKPIGQLWLKSTIWMTPIPNQWMVPPTEVSLEHYSI